MCLGALMLRNSGREDFREIRSPINNVELKNGFLDTHKFFDGTFENEVLSDKPKLQYQFIENAKFPHNWFSPTYRFPHMNFYDKGAFPKVKSRFEATMDFVNNPVGEYWYVYSLFKPDRNLTEHQIRQQLEKLSKYIDINRIIFLGSVRYMGGDTEYNGYPVAGNKFSYVNKAFRNVVGDRYIEVYPSNVYVVGAKDFFDKFDKIINK